MKGVDQCFTFCCSRPVHAVPNWSAWRFGYCKACCAKKAETYRTLHDGAELTFSEPETPPRRCVSVVSFRGRRVGAIGIFHPVQTEVEHDVGDTLEEIQLLVYSAFEHITDFKIVSTHYK